MWFQGRTSCVVRLRAAPLRVITGNRPLSAPGSKGTHSPIIPGVLQILSNLVAAFHHCLRYLLYKKGPLPSIMCPTRHAVYPGAGGAPGSGATVLFALGSTRGDPPLGLGFGLRGASCSEGLGGRRCGRLAGAQVFAECRDGELEVPVCTEVSGGGWGG